MTNEEFDRIVESRIIKINSILRLKGKEYGRVDRLHNFKVAARIDNETPEKSLWGMLKKHVVSVMDIINDLENYNVLPSKELVDEKLGDWINYGILLEALLIERIDEDELRQARNAHSKNPEEPTKPTRYDQRCSDGNPECAKGAIAGGGTTGVSYD